MGTGIGLDWGEEDGFGGELGGGLGLDMEWMLDPATNATQTRLFDADQVVDEIEGLLGVNEKAMNMPTNDWRASLTSPVVLPKPAPKKNASSTTRRACDECRRRKRKCVPVVPPIPTPSSLPPFPTPIQPIQPIQTSEGQTSCVRCSKLGKLCTFDTPIRKRGPKPGRNRKRKRPSSSPSPTLSPTFFSPAPSSAELSCLAPPRATPARTVRAPGATHACASGPSRRRPQLARAAVERGASRLQGRPGGGRGTPYVVAAGSPTTRGPGLRCVLAILFFRLSVGLTWGDPAG